MFVLKKNGSIKVVLPNVGISNFYHYSSIHNKNYFRMLLRSASSSLQMTYKVSINSYYSHRVKGFYWVVTFNYWRFRDWFMRCFYDETTHIIKKIAN